MQAKVVGIAQLSDLVLKDGYPQILQRFSGQPFKFGDSVRRGRPKVLPMDDDVEKFICTSVANWLFQDTDPGEKQLVDMIWAERASIVVCRGDDLETVFVRRRGPDLHTVERCGARSTRLPFAARVDVMKRFRHETPPIGLGVAENRCRTLYIQMSRREIYSSEKDNLTVVYLTHSCGRGEANEQSSAAIEGTHERWRSSVPQRSSWGGCSACHGAVLTTTAWLESFFYEKLLAEGDGVAELRASLGDPSEGPRFRR
jgi:hypothetical protein